MFHENVIKKIPGEIVHNKREGQGFIDNLNEKTKSELEDLLQRQNKLLANKRLIGKLTDKGERIMKFKETILMELERRNQVDRAANLLSRLNIASEGINAVNTLEWTGKYNEKTTDDKVVELNSDNEEDPLRILAQPTGTGVHAKKIIIVQSEESLIKPEDLKEVESLKNDEPTDHIEYIVDMVEKRDKDKLGQLYLPHKTTLTSVHDPDKEKLRKKNKYWEVTAATPPLIVHGSAMTLSLHESLKLQKEQADKLQEIQAKHAIERLTHQINRNTVGDAPRAVGNYRTPEEDSDSSRSGDEEQEVYDEEDTDKAGTVVFPVDTIEIL